MNIRKNAEQKNFIIDKDYYTENELLSMGQQKIIFCIDESFNIKYITDIHQVEDTCFRISTDMCREVKVVYNKNIGLYNTVVITNNNQLIHICL